MEYDEFNSILKQQIDDLSYKRQLQIAIIICKKLFIEYQKFFEVYQWGDPSVLLDAINTCEKSLSNSANIYQIEELLPKIDLVTPDTEDFGDEIGSYALNASAAAYESLQFVLDKDRKHILNIATYYTDTIDFKIQEDHDLSDDEIDKHPLIIEARNFLIEVTK